MIVDKSHSKKDLITLFKNHNVNINSKLKKCDIINDIDTYIDFFIYDDFIKDITELKNYLKNPSNKQRPNVQLKTHLMFKARKIIKWAKNDYILDGLYTNFNEPYDDVLEIYSYGDLPTIRKACELYNASPSKINHINPIMSYEVKKIVEQNKIFKDEYIDKLVIKRKNNGEMFYVNFD